MELRRYLTVLRTRLWLVLITTLLAGLVGCGSTSQPATYVARSTLYVGSNQGSFDPLDAELSGDRVAALTIATLTFARMIDSEPIAQRTTSALGLDRSAQSILDDVTTSTDYQLLYIDVVDEDPATAQALANGFADTFVDSVQEFEPGDFEGSVPRLPAYVFARAVLPTEPVPNGQLRSVILAMVFGFLVAAAVAFLLEYLDMSIRTPADVERRLDLTVLGAVPELPDSPDPRPSVHSSGGS